MLASTLVFTTFVALSSFFVPAVHAITVSINQTAVHQCDTVTIHAAGDGKLDVLVLNAHDECGDPLKSWENVQSGTFHWTVNSDVGSSVLFFVQQQSNDHEDSTKNYTVQAGSTSCLAATTVPQTTTPPPLNSTDGTLGGTGAANVAAGTSGAASVGTPSLNVFATLAAVALALTQL